MFKYLLNPVFLHRGTFSKSASLMNQIVHKFSEATVHPYPQKPEEVIINRNEFIKDKDYKNDFVSIFGFQDTNIIKYDEDGDDPALLYYASIRDKPFYSMEKLFWSMETEINEEDNPLLNSEHGYLFEEDPFDQKMNDDELFLEYLFFVILFAGAGLVLGFQGLNLRGHNSELFEQNLTAEMLEDEIRKIRKQNYELEQEKQKLIIQLSQMQK